MVVAPAVFAGSLAVPWIAAGCVVPPPLEADIGADAGPNSPPIFLEARDSALNPLKPPASITIDRSAAGPISLTLLDNDGADELFIRMFVDYDPLSPLGPRAECIAPAAADGSATRTTSCSTTALCTAPDVTPNRHRLEAEVYDRPLVVGSTSFRETTPPGLSSTWTFDLFCIDSKP